MRTSKGTMIAVPIFLSMAMLSGCTNWQQKYENLNVANENLRGRYQSLQQKYDEQSLKDQQTINELQRQIDELHKTPAQATGFEGYDVAFNAGAGTITVTLPDAILFASGQASLKSATSAPLDNILSVLKQKYPGKNIDVIGHTDSDPIKKSPWKDNWQLSTERALSVTRYLIDRGIAANRIRAAGCGEARPRDSNATAAGKTRNRRVEIVVHL